MSKVSVHWKIPVVSTTMNSIIAMRVRPCATRRRCGQDSGNSDQCKTLASQAYIYSKGYLMQAHDLQLKF